ncbi:acyltransferase [Flavobacterium piscinae]|uniref:Acyltransferase n=2 Tax=Flavobacterium piscinae TaxID=2506424 RepID=A0A4Q1KKB0_9FLAO|nr:acyltransferase [Flavobacterium piscinae]RXR30157.1 acyltransferase [Flavobacterium piscinae]
MIDNQIVASKRIFGLDFLRSLSILLVLFSHISWIYQSEGLVGKMQDFSGLIGIELFLMLSGYLVGSIILKQFLTQPYTIKEVGNFVKRRLFRILPSYYLILVINLLIAIYIGFSFADWWKYFLFVQNFTTPIPSLFPESWSLPIKELSYVAVVIILFAFAKQIRLDFRKTFFLMVVYGLLVLSFLLKVIYHIENPEFSLTKWTAEVRSVVIYRVDSVMFGILFGYYYATYKGFFQLKSSMFFGVGILLMLFFILLLLFFNLNTIAWFWNIIALPFISLIVLCFLPMLLSWHKASKKFGHLVTFLCNLSYSVYLIHYSVVLFLMKYFIDTTSFSLLELHIFTFVYLLITFTLGYFFYTYFEKPINAFRVSNFKLNGKKFFTR